MAEILTLSDEWKRAAGAYSRAADAVRDAERDPRVSDDAYGALVAARERAMVALQAVQS